MSVHLSKAEDMKILARALNGNASLNRWRYVVKDDEGAILHSSPYCYGSEAEALGAGDVKGRELRSTGRCQICAGLNCKNPHDGGY
jgi:hypothetical protein